MHFQAKHSHYYHSLGLQLAYKLLGPDTKNRDFVHEGSKCRRCQEILKWLSKHQERPTETSGPLVVIKCMANLAYQVKFMFQFSFQLSSKSLTL